ncbi:MAG: branched-chain amino acid ABC transporter permease [Chloroflexi bacterium]|nr:branched-chain amino acid ABC transporter permease [Chloroflexota bacterium]
MAASTAAKPQARPLAGIKNNAAILIVLGLLILLPFVIALVDGQSIGGMLASKEGYSKFYQGLLIEIFILAIYAISYDLLFGVTGMLSFGHAMFFAVGAYVTGIALKTLHWSLLPTLGLVLVAGVVQALLFSIVLPRVKGITFALVTLGMASVFHIVIVSHELNPLTGGDVGLQGIPKPAFLNPSVQRLTFYFVALLLTFLVYLVFRRFVNSPTGRVCTAIRENEDRAKMLGYNTFYFKLAALIVSGITAALAGSLQALYQPIVSPNAAGMSFTVAALLMILIGGVGTLSGALVGAAAYRLLDFFLNKAFGESSSFLLGVIYVALVLFVPYGIVGTWQMRRNEIRTGWRRLVGRMKG